MLRNDLDIMFQCLCYVGCEIYELLYMFYCRANCQINLKKLLTKTLPRATQGKDVYAE
jgi:hypothetical protein